MNSIFKLLVLNLSFFSLNLAMEKNNSDDLKQKYAIEHLEYLMARRKKVIENNNDIKELFNNLKVSQVEQDNFFNLYNQGDFDSTYKACEILNQYLIEAVIKVYIVPEEIHYLYNNTVNNFNV